MSTIKINDAKRTIEITKAFAKKAEQFKSDEYNELREAKMENPTYKVVVNKASKRDDHTGLTYDFMRESLSKNAAENGTIMDEFETITKNEDGIRAMSYGEVREWFLYTFPEVDEIFKRREEISKRVKAAKAEMQKAA